MDQTVLKPKLIIFFLLQLILYAAVSRTVQPKESDFPAFYSAARSWSNDQNPYDLEAQCRIQLPIRGVPCLPFAHPPILLPLISLVSNENFESSYFRWKLLLFFITALCIITLYQLARNWALSFQSVLFLPVIIAISLGQDTPFILLAVLLWALFLSRNRDLLAGLALSLAVLKPQIAILLAVPMLFSRPRAFAGFCIGATALLVYSVALVGAPGFRGLLEIVTLMSQTEGFGVNPRNMLNATALLVRAGLSASWSWVILGLGLIAVSVVWKKKGTSLNELGPGIIVALFCAPHLHFHDLSLLIVSLILLPKLSIMLCSVFLLVAYALGLHQWAGYALMLGLALPAKSWLRQK